jgi:hypothetical protein
MWPPPYSSGCKVPGAPKTRMRAPGGGVLLPEPLHGPWGAMDPFRPALKDKDEDGSQPKRAALCLSSPPPS